MTNPFLGRNSALIRKPLDAVVFVSDFEAPAIVSLTTGANADLLPLPTADDEVQLATITGTPTGGTFTLTYAGQTTAGIAFNAAAAAVQSALEALSNVAPGDITVTGSAGGPYTLTFGGTLADENVAQLTASAAGLTGGTTPAVTVTTSAAGGSGGYDSLGWLSRADGLNWTRQVDTSDVESHGSVEPTRRDIVRDVTGLTIQAQESKLITFKMFSNVDMSTVTPDPTTGEVTFNRPVAPVTRFYRVMAIGKDGEGDNAWYFARFLPRAMVTEFDDQPWGPEDALVWPITVTATVDNVEGYALREMWGGPAFRDNLQAMGFPAI